MVSYGDITQMGAFPRNNSPFKLHKNIESKDFLDESKSHRYCHALEIVQFACLSSKWTNRDILLHLSNCQTANFGHSFAIIQIEVLFRPGFGRNVIGMSVYY
jgi:hypothetical protein